VSDQRHTIRERMILEAAHAALLDRGYAQMNLDDLARELGIGKATLYKHFASKEDLAAAVVAFGMNQAGELQRAVPTHLPPLQRLETMLRIGVRNRVSMNPTALGVPLEAISSHPRVVAARIELSADVAAMLEAARASGELRPHFPTPFLVAWVANLFGSGIDFVNMMTGLSPDEVADLAIDAFMRGLSASPDPASAPRGPAGPPSP
jgi:TetR/AcrR family transcriptional regulator of autoinduction and epiphytic fitness